MYMKFSTFYSFIVHFLHENYKIFGMQCTQFKQIYFESTSHLSLLISLTETLVFAMLVLMRQFYEKRNEKRKLPNWRRLDRDNKMNTKQYDQGSRNISGWDELTDKQHTTQIDYI